MTSFCALAVRAALSAALSAIDIALWDILGKDVGKPVHQLLGGKVRDKVKVFANVGGATLDERARQARGFVEQGYTSLRTVPFSLGQLTSCGIDPRRDGLDVVVVKGVHAPVAAYEPVCGSFIRVNTPGTTTADMASLPYRHRRRPLFPFEDVP